MDTNLKEGQIYKVAVVGNSQFIQLFKAAGYEIFTIQSKDECAKLLEDLRVSGKYAIVFVAESIFPETKSATGLPIVALLPETSTEKNRKEEKFAALMERAIGSVNFNLLK